MLLVGVRPWTQLMVKMEHTGEPQFTGAAQFVEQMEQSERIRTARNRHRHAR